MSKSRKLIELKEKNYSHVKKKTTTTSTVAVDLRHLHVEVAH